MPCWMLVAAVRGTVRRWSAAQRTAVLRLVAHVRERAEQRLIEQFVAQAADE
jgi:hypothetical protein